MATIRKQALVLSVIRSFEAAAEAWPSLGSCGDLQIWEGHGKGCKKSLVENGAFASLRIRQCYRRNHDELFPLQVFSLAKT